MSMQTIAARLRTLFAPGRLAKRYPDGRAQVESHNGRVTEAYELFPYGFVARATSGKALTLCQGGNPGGTVILPIIDAAGDGRPELSDGDVALYTEGGTQAILRKSGAVEINAKGSGSIVARGAGGKLYLGNDLTNMCEVLIGMIDEIKGLATTGSPNAHAINPASQARLESYKATVKNLLKESA